MTISEGAPPPVATLLWRRLLPTPCTEGVLVASAVEEDWSCCGSGSNGAAGDDVGVVVLADDDGVVVVLAGDGTPTWAAADLSAVALADEGGGGFDCCDIFTFFSTPEPERLFEATVAALASVEVAAPVTVLRSRVVGEDAPEPVATRLSASFRDEITADADG